MNPLEFSDARGRRWRTLRTLAHSNDPLTPPRALLVQRTSGSKRRVGTCYVRFLRGPLIGGDDAVEIVSRGKGHLTVEVYDDGRERRDRAPQIGEVVARVIDPVLVTKLREIHEDMRAEQCNCGCHDTDYMDPQPPRPCPECACTV